MKKLHKVLEEKIKKAEGLPKQRTVDAYTQAEVDALLEALPAPGDFTGDLDDITEGTTNKHFTSTEKTKLSGIQEGADVNNISDEDATELTGGGETALHSHTGSGGLSQAQTLAIGLI